MAVATPSCRVPGTSPGTGSGPASTPGGVETAERRGWWTCAHHDDQGRLPARPNLSAVRCSMIAGYDDPDADKARATVHCQPADPVHMSMRHGCPAAWSHRTWSCLPDPDAGHA